MPLRFDSPYRLCLNGLTGKEVTDRMKDQIEEAAVSAAFKASNYKTGPATRAHKLVKKWKRDGYRPTYASDRGNRFVISGVTNAGHGADKHMGSGLTSAIRKQDKARTTRMPSEFMHRVLCSTNYNEHDTDLALPGPTETTEIVSAASTRALGFAPLITPPSMIQLTCKYQIGEVHDMPIELV